MSKKRSTKQWIKILDKEMSKLVREKGYCERCGKTFARLEHSHVISRANKTLRWDIINALCMDGRCHKFWWHEEPTMSGEWFRRTFPGRWEYLKEARKVFIKRTDEDYQKILDNIRNKKIKELVAVPELLIDKPPKVY